jgi:hypothetical protein
LKWTVDIGGTDTLEGHREVQGFSPEGGCGLSSRG